MSAAARPATGATLVAWACLTLAGAFVGWLGGSSPAELAEPQLALHRYILALGSAAVLTAALTAASWALRRGELLARAAAAAGLCYLGFPVVAGLTAAPWIALALAVAACMPRPLWESGGRGASPGPDRHSRASHMLLLAHAMGTMTGAYYVFSLDRYLPGWAALAENLRGLLWAWT